MFPFSFFCFYLSIERTIIRLSLFKQNTVTVISVLHLRDKGQTPKLLNNAHLTAVTETLN